MIAAAAKSGRFRQALKIAPLLLALAATTVEAAPAPDRFANLPAAVQPFVDQGQISGAVMLVADRTHILSVSAVGQSDLATGRKMQTDDVFWIASMTKPMTAIALGILVDQGKLSFDDPVEKYLPEFRNQWVVQDQSGAQRTLVHANRPITIRDLLTHTSGLGEYPVTSPHWTSSEFGKVVAREPLRFQPGSKWSYSTAGINVASHIVEVVSGQSFADFMQQKLFNPLGMKDSTFWIRPEQVKRYAHSYKPDPQTGKLTEATIDYMYGGAVTDRQRPSMGGAGLFSTAQDVARVYEMMLNGGTLNGHRILKPETVAELIRPQTGDLKARPGMPWGLGFSIIADPTQMEANASYSPGSFGHGGAFGTNSWADPKTGIIHIFMIQRDKMVPPNPDNSPMRQAYEKTLAADLTPTVAP
jgi:CubicO group peptidase (beta-lactamase class C family)